MYTAMILQQHLGISPSCECDDWMRDACKNRRFYKEHNGKRYCVFHYPGIEKTEEFKLAVQEKIAAGDLNFQGVTFPDNFVLSGSERALFEIKGNADFTGAQCAWHFFIQFSKPEPISPGPFLKAM
jgi:hypothetical protein